MQAKMDLRGGSRQGSGRKPLAKETEMRKVSITLPVERWAKIDQMMQEGHFGSVAEYFRLLDQAQN